VTLHATLSLELIAENFFWEERQRRRRGFNRDDDPVPFEMWLRQMSRLGPDKSPTWVARVKAFGKRGAPLDREFINCVKDYTNSNRVGSRGVVGWYVLREGVYEINHRYKYDRVRRYFVISENGAAREATKEEAMAWLSQKDISASAS
jgi:hypothetical protein